MNPDININQYKNPPLRSLKGLAGIYVEMLCCWLIGLGILIGMKQLFRFDNPDMSIVLRCTVVTVILFLITCRKWLPAIIAAIGVLICILLTVAGMLPPIWEYIRGFVQWWIGRFPPHSLYTTTGNIELVQWLITLSISALVQVLVRRIRIISVLAGFVFILFLVIILAGFHESYYAILIAGMGLIIIGARNTYIRNARHSTLLSSNPHRVAAWCTTVCALLAIVSRLIVPADTKNWGLDSLRDIWDSIPDRLRQPINEPFSLELSGLKPDPYHLGGDINLKHIPVMNVDTELPMLMRGTVYTEYTGTGWERGLVSRDYLVDYSDFFNSTFDLDLPLILTGNYISNDLIVPYSSSVKLLEGGYTLFTNGKPEHIAFSSSSRTPYYNNKGELYTRQVMQRGQKYYLTGSTLYRGLPGFTEAINDLSRTTGQNQWINQLETRYYQLQQEYCVLPADLPQVIYKTAETATRQYTSAYDKMTALENYLKQNFEYTLTPGNVPRNRDFVEYFLETKRGYCVYYASAMTVMARTLGIPSRFIVGYGLEMGQEGWIAYKDTAHAWVECYFRNVGWVPFDPTGGSSYMNPQPDMQIRPVETMAPTQPIDVPGEDTNNDGNGETSDTSLVEGDISTESSAPIESGVSTDPLKHGRGDGTDWFSAVIRILIALAIPLLAASAIVYRFLYRRSSYEHARIAVRFHDTEKAAEYIYKDMLRQLSALGIIAKPWDTALVHSVAARKFLVENSGEDGGVCNAFHTIMAFRYGDITPSGQEIESMCATHHFLDQCLRKNLGNPRYFLYMLLARDIGAFFGSGNRQ